MANGNKEDPIAKALYLIFGIYIIFLVIKAFVESDPSFGMYGWPILGAIVSGVIIFFREKLF
ncbi:hypothetical protein HQ533_01075 [Candidatus Woesearchaeota archaeon]|nr:hypothetical protein [Candidatus Woesearchaeota archaeon]